MSDARPIADDPREAAHREAIERAERAEQALEAILGGGADALVVPGVDGPRVFIREGADRQYRAIIELMAQGVAVCDAEGRVLQANQALIELLGVERAAVVGRPIAALVQDESAATFGALIAAAGPGRAAVGRRGPDPPTPRRPAPAGLRQRRQPPPRRPGRLPRHPDRPLATAARGRARRLRAAGPLDHRAGRRRDRRLRPRRPGPPRQPRGPPPLRRQSAPPPLRRRLPAPTARRQRQRRRRRAATAAGPSGSTRSSATSRSATSRSSSTAATAAATSC